MILFHSHKAIFPQKNCWLGKSQHKGWGNRHHRNMGELLKSSIKDLESGSRCMYPDCGEPPIDAHMLSKANWLGTLSEDDTVLKINQDAPGRRMFLDKVKVGRVSTERCFCAKHDNELFHMLDTSGYPISAEWSFKLA